ncbi:pili assembly chaperone [Citrobacter sp. MH181794]|nr:pili assembly chaperone [Citrobacter sp. MH181794]
MNKFMLSGILLMMCCNVQAGIVSGATRFIFPSNEKYITISLTNTNDEVSLISAKIKPATAWQGIEAMKTTPPFILAPALFLIKPQAAGMLRIIRIDNTMPVDRETLFELSISGIPSGKVNGDSVKIAVRSTFKLFWRPQMLSEQHPEKAYQQLKWTINQNGSVVIDNPTPFYITLAVVSVNGEGIANAGMVAPKTTRQTNWCRSQKMCHLNWRTIDDYGGLSPQVTTILR